MRPSSHALVAPFGKCTVFTHMHMHLLFCVCDTCDKARRVRTPVQLGLGVMSPMRSTLLLTYRGKGLLPRNQPEPFCLIQGVPCSLSILLSYQFCQIKVSACGGRRPPALWSLSWGALSMRSRRLIVQTEEAGAWGSVRHARAPLLGTGVHSVVLTSTHSWVGLLLTVSLSVGQLKARRLAMKRQ